MSPNAPRIAAGLVFGFLLAGCHTQIQQGLDERQANELQTVLIERGFGARKVLQPGKKPTWSIEVDDEHASDSVRVLSEMGLPRPKAPTTADVLGGGGLVPTPAEERARQVLGLSGDLAQTLETVDGVTSARVHLVLPPTPRPGQSAQPAKASAFLRVRPGAIERVNQGREELRALVAGSVEGLSIDNVTLVVNEVSTAVPTPKAEPSPLIRLRMLVFGLGLAVTVLSVLMVLLTVRLRQVRTQAAIPPAPAQTPPRPVVSSPVARKVA
ncbi:MAG: flagellar M-ring protein FliF [Myxococcaceae bacterium]